MRQTLLNKAEEWLAYCLALSMAVIVYGAIPFFSVSSLLGPVVWTSIFAKSFLNAGCPAIRAVNLAYLGVLPWHLGYRPWESEDGR